MAVASSKHMLHIIGDRTCRDFVHPWSKSCKGAVFYMTWRALLGSARFFLPFYLMKGIMNGPRVSKTEVRQILVDLCRSLAFGTSIIPGIFMLHCFFRHLIGGYTSATAMFVPTMIAGSTIAFEVPHRRPLELFYFATWVLEWQVKRLQTRFPALGRRLIVTFLFMLSSSWAMFLMRRRPPKSNIYWIFKPPVFRKDEVEQKKCLQPCPHKGSCCKDIINASKPFIFITLLINGKYLGVGLLVQLINNVVRNWGKRQNVTSIKSLGLGIALGGYVALYKSLSCALCHIRGKDSELYAIPSGFLAGAAFWFNPNLTIELGCLTTILQMLCQHLWSKSQKFHVVELLFIICKSILVSAYFLDRQHCPAGVQTVIDTVSDHWSRDVYNNLHGLK